MESNLKEKARKLYITTGYSLSVVADLLKGEGTNLEQLKDWSKTEGWEIEKSHNLQSKSSDADRIQVMKDRAYSMACDPSATASDIDKAARAFAALSKIVVPPERGGETSPNDLLGQ